MQVRSSEEYKDDLLDSTKMMCETPLVGKKWAQKSSNEAEASPRIAINLKQLAAHLELSPTAVSLVLNDSALAGSIPASTKKRIVDAALSFDYHPNPVARSLRARQSFTLGVMVPELNDGYSAMVLSGIEDCLLEQGYLYFVASHLNKRSLIDRYPALFLRRRVDGIIAVDTPLHRNLPIPVVAVSVSASGNQDIEGLTTVGLNHIRAASLALTHLIELGHRRIAFIRGQTLSSDTDIRWRAIRREARRLGIAINPRLVAQLEGDSPSPELGYVATRTLLEEGPGFTALLAFNDGSAIGAVRALRETGLLVPEDVSVLDFDEVYNASDFSPALTTIRRPFRKMGRLAADTILQRIATAQNAAYPKEVVVEPCLIIRQSTSHASVGSQRQLKAV